MRLGKTTTTIITEATTTTHGERNENETQLENEIGKWAMRTITKTTTITKQLVETPSEVRSKQSEANRIQIWAYIYEYISVYMDYYICMYVSHCLMDNERLQRIV